MEKVVTMLGENGVKYSASLTREEADYFLRLAQWRASSGHNMMHEFGKLLLSKEQKDSEQNKDQYN